MVQVCGVASDNFYLSETKNEGKMGKKKRKKRRKQLRKKARHVAKNAGFFALLTIEVIIGWMFLDTAGWIHAALYCAGISLFHIKLGFDV